MGINVGIGVLCMHMIICNTVGSTVHERDTRGSKIREELSLWPHVSYAGFPRTMLMTKHSEHLKRFHSSARWCLKCKRFFSDNSKDDHIRCEEKEWPVGEELTPKMWMSSDQEAQHKQWPKSDVPRIEAESQKDLNWRKIYKSLFPEAQVIPSACKRHLSVRLVVQLD